MDAKTTDTSERPNPSQATTIERSELNKPLANLTTDAETDGEGHEADTESDDEVDTRGDDLALGSQNCPLGDLIALQRAAAIQVETEAQVPQRPVQVRAETLLDNRVSSWRTTKYLSKRK